MTQDKRGPTVYITYDMRDATCVYVSAYPCDEDEREGYVTRIYVKPRVKDDPISIQAEITILKNILSHAGITVIEG